MDKEKVDRIDKKIVEHEKAIQKLNSLVPFGILTVFAFGFLFPLLPRQTGQLTDLVSYPLAVFICSLLGGLIYLYGYRKAVGKRKKYIEELQGQLSKKTAADSCSNKRA